MSWFTKLLNGLVAPKAKVTAENPHGPAPTNNDRSNAQVRITERGMNTAHVNGAQVVDRTSNNSNTTAMSNSTMTTANTALLNSFSFRVVPDWNQTVTFVRAVLAMSYTKKDGTKVDMPTFTVVYIANERQYYAEFVIKDQFSRKLFSLCKLAGIEIPAIKSQEELINLLRSLKSMMNQPFHQGGLVGERLAHFMFIKDKQEDEKGRSLGLPKGRAHHDVFLREYTYEVSASQAEAFNKFAKGELAKDRFLMNVGGNVVSFTRGVTGNVLHHNIPVKIVVK
jgi:hypothetical protein